MRSNEIPLQMMTDAQLGQALQEQLGQQPVNEQAVSQLMEQLRQREETVPTPGPQAQRAWENYRQKTRRPEKSRKWILRAACILLVVCLALLLPTRAGAENLWQRLARWTDSVFEMFSPGTPDTTEKYEFQTDHPGLRQLYDTVTSLGVTQPVVPMWLPEGYTLEYSKELSTPQKVTCAASFSNGSSTITYNLFVYDESTSNKYQKDDTSVSIFECGDTEHYIMRNKDVWSVVWTKDNIECSISVNCQEDVLYKILRSIYTKEYD